jgi:hypothetical protein
LMQDEDLHHHHHHHHHHNQQHVVASPVEVAASATSHALPHSLLARTPTIPFMPPPPSIPRNSVAFLMLVTQVCCSTALDPSRCRRCIATPLPPLRAAWGE